MMDIAYNPRGNAPWHYLEGRAILSYEIMNTPRPLAATWIPLNVRVVREKIAPDIYEYSGRFALNEKALSVLQPLLGDDVEALPLNLPKVAKDVGPLVVLHALGGEVDHGGDDIFAKADSFVFRRQDVLDRTYFKSGLFTFVSDEIRQAIEEAGLTGVSFRKPRYKVHG